MSDEDNLWPDDVPAYRLSRGTATFAEMKDLKAAVRALMDPVETAGNRCLAQDGPVGDDLLMVTQDKDLRRKFDKAYQRLRAMMERIEEPDE